MSDDDCKKKFGCLAKPAAPRGPKPVKNAIFEDIKKKGIIEKIASKLVGISRRKYYRLLPK